VPEHSLDCFALDSLWVDVRSPFHHVVHLTTIPYRHASSTCCPLDNMTLDNACNDAMTNDTHDYTESSGWSLYTYMSECAIVLMRGVWGWVIKRFVYTCERGRVRHWRMNCFSVFVFLALVTDRRTFGLP
jgi:hypothetical protein